MADEEKTFNEASKGSWEVVLADTGTADWTEKWFLDGQVGEVATSPEGMTLTAGPEFGNDAHHMVLWTKESFEGDLKIEYEYTRLDEERRGVTILYIQATGSGKGPYHEDIAKWNELRRVPAMRTYYNHMHAVHLSYAAYGNSGTDEKSYIRGRRYLPDRDGLTGTELTPDYYSESLFATGVRHRITVIKRDRYLFIRIESPDEVFYGHMTHREYPAVTEGRVGLRHMFTRSARYRNIRISQPGKE